MRIKTAIGCLLAVAVMAMWGSMTAQAHKGAHGVVKQRMTMMKGMKDRLKQMGAMVSGKTDYNDRMMRQALSYIKAHAGAKLTGKFPKGSKSKHSEASPAIWKDWKSFEKKAAELATASENMLGGLPKKGADPFDLIDNLQGPFQALKKACKSCHDQFRE